MLSNNPPSLLSRHSNQEGGSPLEVLLVTLRLRVLEEVGKTMGADVAILPKLASLEDPALLRTKTIEHLAGYVFCSIYVLPSFFFFLVVMISLFLSRFITACLHSLIRDTSLTIAPFPLINHLSTQCSH
jgi:hypothetical protein